MGSPLAPVLANLFMGHHEKDWLQKYKGPEVLFYRRYVDDTFCLFSNDNDASQFFDFINSQLTYQHQVHYGERGEPSTTLFGCACRQQSRLILGVKTYHLHE